MNTEKIILQQAKNSLKGNWVLIISAFLFVCTGLLCLQYLNSLALVALNAVDIDTGEIKDGCSIISYCADILTFIAIFLLSPLVNGLVKICYTVSHNVKPNINMLFSYFGSFSIYLKTLKFNFLFLMLVFFMVCIYNIEASVLPISGEGLWNNPDFGAIALHFLSLVLMTATILLFLFIFFTFLLPPLFLYADSSDRRVSYYLGNGFAMSLKYVNSRSKLFFRFLGRILLCFFVVPAFYVVPYIAVSFATSEKWLISLEKGRDLL